jgi:hypothetical protein
MNNATIVALQDSGMLKCVPELAPSFPGAMEWMWDHCLFLGTHNDADGEVMDLGIHCFNGFIQLAVVYGNEPGEYISNTIDSLSRYEFGDLFRELMAQHLNQ